MRRMISGLIPAVMFVTAVGTVGAQSRTAPSIGDAVRRSSGAVITQRGGSSRSVSIPGDQRCDDRDRADRDREDRDREDRERNNRTRAEQQRIDQQRRAQAERDSRYGNSNRGTGSVNGAYGCCTNNSARGTLGNGNRNGTGTIDTRRGSGNGNVYGKTGVTGNGRVNPNANARNGCGSYDDRYDDRRDDKHKDKRNDKRDNDRDEHGQASKDRDRRDHR